MNRIDHIINSIFDVQAQDADWENPLYATFRSSLTGANIGVAATVGGLIFNTITGAEVGTDVAAGGALVTCVEGLRLALNSDALRRE